MLIDEALKKIANEYLRESKFSTRNNYLHSFIRKQIPEIIIETIGQDKLVNFYPKASGGEGNWRKVPWITILHNKVSLSRKTKNPEANNPSAKWGYYPVYLFKSDMTEILFGLGQAETNIRQDYPKDVETILKSRAAILRKKVPEYKEFFDDKLDQEEEVVGRNCACLWESKVAADIFAIILEANNFFRFFLILHSDKGLVTNGRIKLRLLKFCFLLYMVAGASLKSGTLLIRITRSAEYPENITLGKICMGKR